MTYDACAELGLGWVRTGWSMDQDTNGANDRPALLNKLYNNLGIWCDWVSDARDESIAQTADFVKRHEAWIRVLELDNELDAAGYGKVFDGYELPGNSTFEFRLSLAIDRCKKVIAAVNAAGKPSTLLISSPSMANTLGPGFDRMGVIPGLDLTTFHDYGGGIMHRPYLMDYMVSKINLMKTLGGISTECGFSTAMGQAGGHPPVTEQVQAMLTPSMFLEHVRTGKFVATINYLLISKLNSSPWENGFGLVEQATGRRKPAFHSMRRLLAWNKDPSDFAWDHELVDPKISIGGTNIRSTMSQKADGTTLVHLWLNGDATAGDNQQHQDQIVNNKSTATLAFDRPRDYIIRNVMQDDIVKSSKGVSALTLTIGSEPTVVEVAP